MAYVTPAPTLPSDVPALMVPYEIDKHNIFMFDTDDDNDSDPTTSDNTKKILDKIVTPSNVDRRCFIDL